MTEMLYSPKIKPEHLARKAIVYLRQSSEKQVRQNKESQRLQYDVVERMRQPGLENRGNYRYRSGIQCRHRFGPPRRIGTCPQLGGIRRGRNRRQLGSLKAIAHGQRLVPATRGVP